MAPKKKVDKAKVAAALKAHEKAVQKAKDKALLLAKAARQHENHEAAEVGEEAAKVYVELREKVRKSWWKFWD